MDHPQIDPEIRSYYEDAWDEDARLREGMGELEFLRTQEIVRRSIPNGPLRILDVGGASGVHAEWLLDDGHAVHLVDPVPLHVDQATARLGDRRGFRASVGDGRRLEVPDHSQDVVLLFGPLYHLTVRSDRLATWREAARALVPGGVVLASVISRFSSLFSGLATGEVFDPGFRAVVERDLVDGQHRNPARRDWFTTAYFHHPDEVGVEAAEAGLEVSAVLGVEGIAPWVPGLERSWGDPASRQVIIDTARAIESEPTLLGLGPHLIAIAGTPPAASSSGALPTHS